MDDNDEAERLARMLAERQQTLSAAKAAKARQSLMDPRELRTLAEAAMRRHRCLRIGYHGSFRLIEVHIVGRTSKGREALAGYQVTGGGPKASSGWRNMVFDDIISAEIDDRASLAPRSDYNPDDLNFPEVYWQV
ncbi:MAG: hypothetical protein ABL879_11465 [Devosia sp.]